MHKITLRSLIPLIALLCSTASSAACVQIDGMEIPALSRYLVETLESPSTKTAQHIEPLKNAYTRIAAVAKIRPALLVCNNDIINAEAIGTAKEGLIVFYRPILELLAGDIDEIAAVMAHEFSHLLLDHKSQKGVAHANLASWAKAIAQDRYRRTGNANLAIKSAEDFMAIEFMKFSRSVERDADDKGFSLAITLAKFNGDGFKRVAQKLGQLPPSNRPPYLDSHPGWLERFEKADLLTLNQYHMESAQALFLKQDWKALAILVRRWLAQIPSSGAAWYYEGRLLARKAKNPSQISKAFEDAASLYVENPVLGVRSQEDQIESAEVWFYLCLALFDEGYKFESASCSRHITNEAKHERFQAMTFGAVLIVAGNEQAMGNLLIARESDGSKLFTNDISIATSRGAYKPVSPAWKAIR